MNVDVPPWGCPAAIRRLWRRGQMMMTQWQTRGNPAAQSYGTGTGTWQEARQRYVRRTANRTTGETLRRKGWTFSMGNRGMVARLPDIFASERYSKGGF